MISQFVEIDLLLLAECIRPDLVAARILLSLRLQQIPLDTLDLIDRATMFRTTPLLPVVVITLNVTISPIIVEEEEVDSFLIMLTSRRRIRLLFAILVVKG